jgi:hypothetical protein
MDPRDERIRLALAEVHATVERSNGIWRQHEAGDNSPGWWDRWHAAERDMCEAVERLKTAGWLDPKRPADQWSSIARPR